MDYPLIGFSGLKGAGKDAAASVLVEHGWKNVKMAGALKAMLSALLAYQGAAPGAIQAMVEGGRKEEPSRLLGGQSMRHAMVTLGTEWGRDLMHPQIWVDVTAARILSLRSPVVVSDVRFPNEVDMVHALGGIVVRIDRPGLTADRHSSEALVSKLIVDWTIQNDRDLHHLRERALATASAHVSGRF